MVRIITDYLDETAKKYPNKIAFSDEHREITFGELREEALTIATIIIKKRIYKQPIAVFLDKSVECIVAFMGILYSGNFYTPLDTQMPSIRLKKIIETLKPVFIVTDDKHKYEVVNFASSTNVIDIKDISCLNINKSKVGHVINQIVDTDLAYVLFTSGSTGVPKGVVISHKSVIAYTEWVSDAFDINEKTVIGNQTPFYFSMSVLDIFQTLRNASTLYIIPKILFSFPIKLLEYIGEKNINFIYWVPSALCQVANLRALGKRDISCLKQILFAGEVMPAKQLNLWRRNLPETIFANLFGPTEVTDICTYYILNREIMDDEPVPIGTVCKNSSILILDENNKEVCYGGQGELCVRGSILAYGYYNNKQKTDEVFVQNPINALYPEFIYRTGDLVHFNDLGEIIYDGRKDFQIKHMGNRIELGEIETAAYSIAQILQCCCLYDTKKCKIVLFYSGNIDEQDVLLELQSKIPSYMVPNRIIRKKSLPLNLNGKIDRIQLKELI